MLRRLSITNLAIIENIDVSFGDGFTVLTGGTGAGKSLIIDSLSLLLGARASTELIRQGEEKAIIQGFFEVHSARLEGLLSNLEIPFVSGELLIERIITKNKNTVKANGMAISLTDLNKIAKHLADIHSQFDFAKILNPENYLEIIDGFSYEMTTKYKKEYLVLLDEYRTKKREYQALLDRKAKLEESRDFYEYQYKELKAMGLSEDEEADIESEIALLSNYDKVYSLSQEANEIIHEDFLDRLYELNRVLDSLSAYQKQYKQIHDSLDEKYYEIDDMLTDLKKSFQNIDYDPERLNELQQRQSDINALKRKYKKDVPGLIELCDELESMIGENSNFDEGIAEKKGEVEKTFRLCIQKGKELTLIRKKLASSIEKELTSNLDDLLLKAKFQVSFNDYKEGDGDVVLKENGLDEVDFLIETNIGEGLKSLSKVVSGGEASRIMLGFKAIFIKANKVSTVIFDEIDTGISGEAAEAVAKKIHDISLISQVISITHLPQVASLSDHSILISKNVKNGRTYTSVKELTLDEKIHEVAHLISGGTVTEKQLAYAKEMVLSNR